MQGKFAIFEGITVCTHWWWNQYDYKQSPIPIHDMTLQIFSRKLEMNLISTEFELNIVDSSKKKRKKYNEINCARLLSNDKPSRAT